MSADKYRPWELHRPRRCAACGRIAELGDNGLCVECESRWASEPIVAAPVRRQSRDTL